MSYLDSSGQASNFFRQLIHRFLQLGHRVAAGGATSSWNDSTFCISTVSLNVFCQYLAVEKSFFLLIFLLFSIF
jgi:hypothetical protein